MPCRARPRPRQRILLGGAPLLLASILGLGPAPASAAGPDATGAPLGTRLVLPNGLVVLVAERPGLPIVTVEAAVLAGASLDPPDRAGLANLTALLLTRGAASRSGPELDRAIEFVGGSLEGAGGRDASRLVLTVLRKDLDLGLDLLADALTRPTFPEAELERKREEVRASIRQSEEDPAAVAARRFRALAFPGHPYGLPIDGTEASLGRITREAVVAFHDTAYRPDATTIAVAGDVTAAAMRSALAERLGHWTVSGAAPRPPGPAPLAVPARTDVLQRDLTQATVVLGAPSVGRRDPDYYALALASYVLGGGSSSRLYTRVREERGLAYSVDAEYAAMRLGGTFTIEFQSRNAQVREVLGLVRQEIVRLGREPVPAGELRRAKAYLIGSFPLRMDTNADVAQLLVRTEQLDLGLDYPARYRRALEAVTPGDLLRAVRTHWDPDRLSLVVVANLREAGLETP